MKKASFILTITVIACFQAIQLSAADDRKIPSCPPQLEYCGMMLEITPSAQIRIQEYINHLHKSETYFQTLVSRAELYMPIVEQAFSRVDVPEDLKYICLLESALIGNAVSRSNAVGFWQFKDFTAREVGLVVDDKIDERKHIFMSSLGAAKYFYRLNEDFDNWIYAVIGYNRGPSGAIPYTDTKYYGKRTMKITSDLHPYALKSIAHKLAFENEIGKQEKKSVWLEGISTRGESSVSKLAEKAGLTISELKEYNLWISGYWIPAYPPRTFYVPRNEAPVAELAVEEEKKPEITPLPEKTVAEKINEKLGKDRKNRDVAFKKNPENKEPLLQEIGFEKFEVRDIHRDPAYGEHFALLGEESYLAEVAVRFSVNLKNLKRWNGIYNAENPEPGTVLLLESPQKAHFHIVKSEETLRQIASRYGLKVRAIQRRNRMSKGNFSVYPNQKLYLREKKPRDEKIIILENDILKKMEAEEKELENKEKIEKKQETKVKEEVSEPVVKTEKKSKIVWHKVEKGETLWQMYRKYGCRVEIIKKMNDLKSDELFPGQVVKVLVWEEVPID